VKTLTLLRHAKSSWDDPHQRDFDRVLNDRGRRAAPRIGHYLRAEGAQFDAVICSPAARTRETLALVAEGYGAPLEAQFDERIYMASHDTLLDLVHELPDSVRSVLLVGHNPGFEDLALHLVGSGPEKLRSALAAKFPTGTLAEIGFDVDQWSGVKARTGRLLRYVRPRHLDADLDGD
jgi:phosphohistidine phosphatase